MWARVRAVPSASHRTLKRPYKKGKHGRRMVAVVRHTNRLAADRGLARVGIAVLSFVGILDALYMLAYSQGLIDSLVCPFLGQGCNIVGRSRHARHFGVPNAAVGALGYATMGILAIRSGNQPRQYRSLRSSGLPVISLAAFLTSVFLTWEQGARVKAWCFWCLLSTGINLIILPLALWEARKQEGL